MGETPFHKFRCSDELWEKAVGKAQREDTSVSSILRARLEEFTADDGESLLVEVQKASAKLAALHRRYMEMMVRVGAKPPWQQRQHQR
jgi:hypothetical protein